MVAIAVHRRGNIRTQTADAQLGGQEAFVGTLPVHEAYVATGLWLNSLIPVAFATFALAEGTFIFYDGFDPGRLSSIQLVSAQRLLMDGVTRIDEIKYFREKIPSGDYVPVIRLHEMFGVTREHESDRGIIVVIEGDGRRAGLLVDDLLGQQQVVIKSLDTNFGRVDGVSGATILGDGSVALILDLPGIIRRANARLNS